MRRSATAAAALVAVLGGAVATVLALGGISRPILWELPAGYRGWVVTWYEDRSCPPLPTRGLFLVARVSPEGRVCTANPTPYGWRFERVESVAASGARTALRGAPDGGAGVWAAATAPRQAEVPYPTQIFFVGTRADLEGSWATQPRTWERGWWEQVRRT